MPKNNELKFELLHHAPYSRDYFLFPNLKKKELGAKRFASNEEAESAINGYFEQIDDFHYKRGIDTM